MESWQGVTYESIMKIPSDRRRRLILAKHDLEIERQRREERAARRR